MDDSIALLKAIKNMDAVAITKVFDLYAPAIYKYAYYHCGDAMTADQIVGDVFEKLMGQLSEGRGPSSNLRYYLFEMAYHAMVDGNRHSRLLASVPAVEASIPVTSSTDTIVEEQNLLDSVWRVIRRELTEDQRQVIILRFLEDFSLKETALIMGKKVGNIKVIQNRAIGAMRRVLDDQALEHAFREHDTLV